MKLNFTTNRKAKFNGQKFELTGQFEYLGDGAFHLMMDNNYKYFTIDDITINGIDVKSSEDFIKYLISLG
jgi:hypothetical protein